MWEIGFMAYFVFSGAGAWSVERMRR